MILARGHNFSRKFNLGFNVVLSKTIQRRIICLILYRSWLNWLVTNGGIISTAKNGNDRLRKGNRRRHRDLNPGHIGGGRWVLSQLRHPMILAEAIVRLDPTLPLLWSWDFLRHPMYVWLANQKKRIRKGLEAVRWELVPGLPPALCPFVLRLPVNISFPLAATGSPGMD